ncbi:MAG TPA: hypothetical protein VGN17_18435 [Bryobacteraceae bacterium]|jgi:hypothetical protein
MKVDRRTTFGILAAAIAGVPAALAQVPAPALAPASGDALLRAAREGYQGDAQRIASVKLPQATEPAFSFRA